MTGVQTCAEYGIIGLGIVIIMVIITGKSCGQTMNLLKERDDFAYISGYLGAFVAIGVHSFVDFNMRIPGNAMLMAALTGIVFSVRQYGTHAVKEFVLLDFRYLPKNRLFFSLVSIFLAGIFTTIGFVVISRRYIGEYYYHLARQDDVTIQEPITNEKEIPEEIKQGVVDNYLRADHYDSENPAYAGALANVFILQSRSPKYYELRTTLPRSMAESRIQISAREDELLGKTLERVVIGTVYGEKAARGNPMKGIYHLRLAQGYDILCIIQDSDAYHMFEKSSPGLRPQTEYMELAEKQFKLAVAQHPNRPFFNQELARFYLRHRKYNLARENAIKTIELLKTRPEWQAQKAVEVLESIAEAYFRQQKYAEAKQVITEAMQTMTGHLEWKRKKAQGLLDSIEKAIVENKSINAVDDTN